MSLLILTHELSQAWQVLRVQLPLKTGTFVLGGKRFHKKCFKCTNCSKKLDSFTVRTHDGALYCRQCHLNLGPQESPKIYADTAVIKPEDGKVSTFTTYPCYNARDAVFGSVKNGSLQLDLVIPIS